MSDEPEGMGQEGRGRGASASVVSFLVRREMTGTDGRDAKGEGGGAGVCEGWRITDHGGGEAGRGETGREGAGETGDGGGGG